MSETPSQAIPDQSIETLQQLPVQVTWSDEGYTGSVFGGSRLRKVSGEFFSIDLQGQSYDDLDQYDQYFELPATFGGAIEEDDEGVRYLSAGTLSVGEDFRGHRLGERLSRAMACIAVEQGCHYIEIGFSHPTALKYFREIFGDDRIQYLPKDVFGQKLAIHMPEQALQAITEERQQVLDYGAQMPSSGGILKHQPKTDDEILPGAVDGVDARINVVGFDISSFDKPIQIGVLPDSEPVDDWNAVDG